MRLNLVRLVFWENLIGWRCWLFKTIIMCCRELLCIPYKKWSINLNHIFQNCIKSCFNALKLMFLWLHALWVCSGIAYYAHSFHVSSSWEIVRNVSYLDRIGSRLAYGHTHTRTDPLWCAVPMFRQLVGVFYLCLVVVSFCRLWLSWREEDLLRYG